VISLAMVEETGLAGLCMALSLLTKASPSHTTLPASL
jgi:hypothetical protein